MWPEFKSAFGYAPPPPLLLLLLHFANCPPPLDQQLYEMDFRCTHACMWVNPAEKTVEALPEWQEPLVKPQFAS